MKIDEETTSFKVKSTYIELAIVNEEEETEFNNISISEPVKFHRFKIVFIPNVKYIVFFVICLFAYGHYYLNKNTPAQ